MSEFYNKLEQLCKNKGITVTTVVKDLNMSSSSGTNWKNGKVPKSDTVKRIAEYFSVPTDYLLSGKTEDKFLPLTDNALALLDVFYKLDEQTQLKVIGRLEMLAMENYSEYLTIAKGFIDSGLSESELAQLLKTGMKATDN